MTRFARAKGSKSSNERTPEESTPWGVMKEQLLQAKTAGEEAKKMKQAEKQRIENYENFLKDHKVQKRKATWCEFPEAEYTKHEQLGLISQNKNKNKQKQTNIEMQSIIKNEEFNSLENAPTKKKSKKKHQNSESVIQNEQNTPSQRDNVEISVEKSQKSKKNKQKLSKTNQSHQHNEGKEVQLDNNKMNIHSHFKNKKLNISSESEIASNQEGDINISIAMKTNKKKKKKKDKLVNGEPVRRKPINDHSFQLIINGKEVELVRFDGFPIMKKDADRLAELKGNMIKKGIPKSEVNRTLKLERRRAEKALARLKRDVCYNCRKGGHNLSDCPELKTKIPGVGAADGVCFKCGSTEHRQFECKVQNDKGFRFATCFICKEPGHIARQCPDNPKGLYPNGGSCKLCGDVTHLRKDCPTATDQKEETSIKLQTLESTEHLEGIEQTTNKSMSQDTSKKPKKIKF